MVKTKRKGYLSQFPETWKVYKIADVLERVKNKVEVKKEEQYLQIGIRSHGKGIFYKEAVSGKELGNKSVFWVEPDCFVVNIVFAWEMAIAKTTKADVGLIASHRFPMYKPDPNLLDLDFLLYYFKMPLGKYLLGLASPGGAGRNKTLGQKEFAELEICIPPITEQKEIVSILSAWDNAIILKERLIEEKKIQKKGLIQKFLSRSIKLNGSVSKWNKINLGNVVKCLDNQRRPLNSEDRLSMKGNIPYYGANGVVDYIDSYLFNEELVLIAEDGGHFKDFSSKDIAYRVKGKSWVNNHAHILKASGINSDFLYYSLVNKDIRKYINGSTRGKLTKSDMLLIEIDCPESINEQENISDILNTAHNSIKIMEKELEEIKEQKRGLMQKLLTGKIEVTEKVN